jgi:hypothetical protein
MNTTEIGSCRYELDDELRIVAFDARWSLFAVANETPRLAEAEHVLGRPLLSFIAGDSTAHLYETLFDVVRRTQRPVTLPFRCDSPSLRRYLDLTIEPRPHGLALSSTLSKAEARPREPLLDAAAARSEEMLRMCSFCKKLKVAAEWMEVEAAVARLRIFDRARVPAISHGLCEPCLHTALAAAEE